MRHLSWVSAIVGGGKEGPVLLTGSCRRLGVGWLASGLVRRELRQGRRATTSPGFRHQMLGSGVRQGKDKSQRLKNFSSQRLYLGAKVSGEVP